MKIIEDKKEGIPTLSVVVQESFYEEVTMYLTIFKVEQDLTSSTWNWGCRRRNHSARKNII